MAIVLGLVVSLCFLEEEEHFLPENTVQRAPAVQAVKDCWSLRKVAWGFYLRSEPLILWGSGEVIP